MFIHNKKSSIGIVLSGGGARGSYQVGVYQALTDIAKKHKVPFNISVYSGVSAGAINATFLAAYSSDIFKGASELRKLWSNLTTDEVFYTDAMQMGKMGFKWLNEMSFGKMPVHQPAQALLDTTPLRKLIQNNTPWLGIQKGLEDRHFDHLCLTAVNYQNSSSYSFIQSRDGFQSWNKRRRISQKAFIQAEHVLASAAIPLLFPPVNVDGAWYGDGCVRNSHPCAPSIYLGAQKLIVIGVRTQTPTLADLRASEANKPPSVARVINALLNAVLLDGIELDVDRLQRLNAMIDQVPEDFKNKLEYRKVDCLMVSPSVDIGEIALTKAHNLPRLIRYLMKGLGKLEDAAEILSYLLFEPEFCSLLIELGYQDGLAQEEKFLSLLTSA